jgi:predicted O-methyltransferase YrrM
MSATTRPPTTADHVARVVALVEGWLSEPQGRALFDAASSTTGRGAIVEIGSWKGRSTIWLAAGAQTCGRRVHAIDPHVNSREDPQANTLADFTQNLEKAGLSDAVEPLIMPSADAARMIEGPVEVLFIDGDHSYEAARRDAELWLPKLVDGATVMFHDVTTAAYNGPRRVFRRHICLSSQFDSIKRVGSMAVARRTRRRNALGAVQGGVAWLLLFIYDAKGGLRRLKRAVGFHRRR